MQDKDSIRSSINKRMNVVHRCIHTPNIVLRALSFVLGNGSAIISGYSRYFGSVM